jgi:hypothetical protein
MELMELKLLSRIAAENYNDSNAAGVEVSDADVRAYYEKHQSDFTVEPHFTAHQLVVYIRGNPAFPDKGLSVDEARKKANRALSALRSGDSWESVVPEYSDEVGSSRKNGLIRDGQFGFFAPEVEEAIRTQALGSLGEPVRSELGYHIIQVLRRVTEKQPRPLSEVEAFVRDRLLAERSARVGEAWLAPIRKEMGLEVTAAGEQEGPLLEQSTVREDTILAMLGKEPVREADFRWFLKDALLPSQRMSAYSRPGARQSMLQSFLDMRVLALKARGDGLDRTPSFIRDRDTAAAQLRAEFNSPHACIPSRVDNAMR